MKKVLIIAYYFPPLGMGGTQRVAKFTRYLPDFGWQPIIVTVKDVAYYAIDQTLIEDVEHAEVHRTGSFDPQRLLYLLSCLKGKSEKKPGPGRHANIFSKLLNYLLIPDSKLLWLPFAFFRCWRILRQNNIKCIVTTSPPHSVHILGCWLKLLGNLAWVADFRDGWAGGNFQEEPTLFHKWLNFNLQKWIVRRADRIVTVSEPLKEKLAMEAEEDRNKCIAITNGFDLRDFKRNEDYTREPCFTITYCGTLTTIAPVDSFLRALANLLNANPQLTGKMAVRFIGFNMQPELTNLISALNLDSVIAFAGYLNHSEALQEMVQADLLLYPIAPEANIDFIPGKTFEYLATGNRILAIGPSRVAGMQILKANSSITPLNHDDLKAIESALANYLQEGQKRISLRTADTMLLKFERSNQAGQLVEVLDKYCASFSKQ